MLHDTHLFKEMMIDGILNFLMHNALLYHSMQIENEKIKDWARGAACSMLFVGFVVVDIQIHVNESLEIA